MVSVGNICEGWSKGQGKDWRNNWGQREWHISNKARYLTYVCFKTKIFLAFAHCTGANNSRGSSTAEGQRDTPFLENLCYVSRDVDYHFLADG